MNARRLIVILSLALCASLALAAFWGQRARQARAGWRLAEEETQRLRASLQAARSPVPRPFARPAEAAAPRAAAQPEKPPLLAETPPAETNRPAGTNRPWGNNGANWMENLKTTDPQRYAEILKSREESRQRMQRVIAEQASYHLQRDTSAMTEPERKEHTQMLAYLDDTWKAVERLQTDLPAEERRDLMRSMRDNLTALEPLMEKDRAREFQALGRSLGYQGAEVQQFAQQLNQIVEQTSMNNLYRAMRPGGAGSGRGFGDRGGPGAANATPRP